MSLEGNQSDLLFPAKENYVIKMMLSFYVC